ncbi:hypothetical protein HG531_012179 [Fusarium graminearum]|nr:hypothetical protein HG531_012179 [Fusarium graminearum]CAF3597018.1 unnamed protein product [Fusarium graminearum]
MSYKSSSKQDSFRGQDVSIPNKEDSLILDENTDPEFNPAPDGGLEAWLVAAGAACIFFSCLGFANSFGVLQEYYMSHQLRGHSADAIAWIGSVSTFIQFAAGALSGPLFDRYGAWVVRPAAVTYIFATMMTSLCTEYWHFMLAQGVLMGSAMAFLQIPAFAAVSQYFDKKRAAAFGIAVSGSSIGGVVFPIALSKMLNDSSLSFGWSIRIMGFVMIPLMSFSCITVRSRLPGRKTSFFLPEAFKNPLFLLVISSLFFLFIGMFAPLFFIPTYAVSRGVNPTLASYFLAITNAASTFGRVIPGVLADKYGRLNVYSLGGLSTGVVILCMNEAKSTAALVVYAAVFGFTSGTIISGVSAAFTLVVKDPRDNGTYMGMGLAVSSLAALIGPPVNGALVDRHLNNMDYTTDEIVNAYQSERLEFIKADKDDTNHQKIALEILKDPVVQALTAPSMLQPKGQQDCKSYLQSVCDSLLGVAICLRDENTKTPTVIGIMCIGWGGISPNVAHHRNAEIGITLIKEHQGKGYGREAINWILDWGFRHAGLHTIGISTASYNPRAVHLYESMGFVHEGSRRATIWQNRGWHDLINFGMTEAEWETLRGLPQLQN